MRQQPLFKCGMVIVMMLLTLRGSAPAQTPTPSATPPHAERLKVAVQLEREQNDPILMTVVYAAQYAPVYEANRAMTLFTSLGPSADCRGLT